MGKKGGASPFDLDPQVFAETGLGTYLATRHKPKKKRLPVLDDFESLWGVAPPPVLEQVIRALAAHGLPELHAWQPSFGASDGHVFGGVVVPRGKNALAHLVETDHLQFLAPQLGQALGGSLFIGTNRDGGQAYVFSPDFGTVHVHDEMSGQIGDAIADDLAAFVTLAAACDVLENDPDGSDAAAAIRAIRAVSQRVAPAGHFEVAEEYLKERTAPPPKGAAPFVWWRGRWIALLLAGQGVEVAFDEYGAEENAVPPESWDGRVKTSDTRAASAVYLLLRCFFLGETERARSLSERHAKHGSALVRDVAELVGAWLAGKQRAIGDVADVCALAGEWQALLAPAKASKDPIENVLAFKGAQAPEAAKAIATLRLEPAQGDAARLVPFVEKFGPRAVNGGQIRQLSMQVVRLFGERRTREAVPVLMALVGAYPQIVEERAGDHSLTLMREFVVDVVEALGKIGDPRAVPALLALFDHVGEQPFQDPCDAAALSLALLGEQGALGPILAWVKEYGGVPGPATALALGIFGQGANGQQRKTLLKVLREASYDRGETLAQAVALARLGEPPDAQALKVAFEAAASNDASLPWALVATGMTLELPASLAEKYAGATDDIELVVLARSALQARAALG